MNELKVHLRFSNGYRFCRNYSVPQKFSENIKEITCKSCLKRINVKAFKDISMVDILKIRENLKHENKTERGYN